MTAAGCWRALLLASMCSACSAPAPPPNEVTGAPLPPGPPSTSASAPAPAPAAQTAPPAAVIEDPVVQAPPVATAPAPTPTPTPAPVHKPRPVTAGKDPAPGPTTVANAPAADAAPVRATVTTLSRGKGVPPETREALKRIRALLEKHRATAAVTDVQVQRLGIEGESRLCIEFRDAAAAEPLLAEMRRLSAGSDLLDITATPCPYRKEPSP